MTPWLTLALLAAQPVAPSTAPRAPLSTAPTAPLSAWWVFGPFACPDEATFAAAEMLDSAPSTEWTSVTALGGRELRARRLTAAAPGTLDLRAALALDRPLTCAYAGVRVKADKAGAATLVLSGSGAVRWRWNGKLVTADGQGRVAVQLKAGWNCLLAKCWHTAAGPWTLGCTLDGPAELQFETMPAEPVAQPGTGRRNVALWREGSRVGVSSVPWRSSPVDPYGRSPLNDGDRGSSWTSHNVAGLPQWAWVRFPGPRRIDRVVLTAGAADRLPLDLVGEYSPDGGMTFRPLFGVQDAHWARNLSLTQDFAPVVTDNVRVRIERALVPKISGFAVARLAELEVWGDDADVPEPPAAAPPVPPSTLRPDAGRPTLSERGDLLEVSTPWYRLTLDRRRPRIAQWSVDALGQGKFDVKLLRPSGAAALLATLFDPPPFPADGALTVDGNVARWPAVSVAPGVDLQAVLRLGEREFDLELTTAASRAVPLAGGVFRFDLDYRQTPTSFFGRSTDPANVVTLPCWLHAPDCGSLRLTQQGEPTVWRQAPSADDFSIPARQLLDIAPASGVLPAGIWRSTLRFELQPVVPLPELLAAEPRLAQAPRWALNIAQWMPGNKVLSNNVVSTNCPLSLQFYAEQAIYAPQMRDGVSLMDLVTTSVDRYLDGLGGHLYWHGLKVEADKWTASLETPGYLLNSAWVAVRTAGGRPLLERWLPRLEAIAAHLEAHSDADGIVNSGFGGHWFDTYKLPPGVKEAHSTAVNCDALRHLADLEDLAGRPQQAAHYRARAQLIRDNYAKVFFNPATGVFAGWRDAGGKLHDAMAPWVNGYALCAGLADDAQARGILDRLLAKLRELGFTQYQYGLPTNLLPIPATDFSGGGREWQGYMNGSITPPYSGYVLNALYRYGYREEAERMLWAQIGAFDRGTFNSGVRIPHLPSRNPVGSAFYYWDGQRANGEGYLPENWHAYTALFAGHFGIRFDEHGYSLEPWSPLKGRRVRCGLPVLGAVQEFME